MKYKQMMTTSNTRKIPSIEKSSALTRSLPLLLLYQLPHTHRICQTALSFTIAYYLHETNMRFLPLTIAYIQHTCVHIVYRKVYASNANYMYSYRY